MQHVDNAWWASSTTEEGLHMTWSPEPWPGQCPGVGEPGPPEPLTCIGKIPGRMGQEMPISVQAFTKLKKVSASKKSWVMMKSAPADTFSFKCFRSSSKLFASGWPLG